MQNKLYEVILTPKHIDIFHTGVIASARMYKGILQLIETGDADVMKWLDGQGLVPANIESIYKDTVQTLQQLDHFVLGTEFPKDMSQELTLCFREAYEPHPDH